MAPGTSCPHHDSELASCYHDAFLPWGHYHNNIVLFYHDSPVTRSYFMDPTDRAIKGFYCITISMIQIWPSCCFYVLSTTRVRFQTGLKSRGGCATKMLHTEIIELLNVSNKFTHVLCIGRKLRSFWVEWCACNIWRHSRTYILNNLIHQLQDVFYFAVHQGAQIRHPITDRKFRTHVQVVRTHMRLQRWCL